MVLDPYNIEPAGIRQVELTAIILMLVASNRGISVLPDWVVRQVRHSEDVVVRPVTREGITRRMYAATRTGEKTLPYLAHFIRLARQEAVKLQRG
jgi:LysR family transcriptional regulator for metE and metH